MLKFRTFLMVAVVAALAAVAAPQPGLAAGGAGETISGRWRSRMVLFDDAVRFELQTDAGEKIRLNLEPRDLDGLTRERLKTTGEPLRFAWVRDAVTIRFEGVGRWFGKPSGSFTVEPDPEFVALLGTLVSATPSAHDLLRLALQDLDLATLHAVRDGGYSGLELDDLTRVWAHGVEPGFIAGMQQLGYRPTIDELVRLRSHGISPEDARELAGLGLTGIPVEDLIRMRLNGLDPDYMQAMAAAGVPPTDVDDLVRLRNHGVEPEQARAMRAVEGFDLAVEQLIRLRTQGVDADYLAGVAAAEKHGLTVEGVIRLYTNGVLAERYREFARLGYADVEEAVRLTNHGIDPAEVGRLAELGYDELTVDELIRLGNHGADAAFVRRLIAAGYGELSVERIIELRTHGIES